MYPCKWYARKNRLQRIECRSITRVTVVPESHHCRHESTVYLVRVRMIQKHDPAIFPKRVKSFDLMAPREPWCIWHDVWIVPQRLNQRGDFDRGDERGIVVAHGLLLPQKNLITLQGRFCHAQQRKLARMHHVVHSAQLVCPLWMRCRPFSLMFRLRAGRATATRVSDGGSGL